jgi:hypothetical protein
MGANEDTILEGAPRVNGCAILDFYAVADPDRLTYICAFSDDAVSADARTLSYLGEVPNVGSWTNQGVACHERRRVDGGSLQSAGPLLSDFPKYPDYSLQLRSPVQSQLATSCQFDCIQPNL